MSVILEFYCERKKIKLEMEAFPLCASRSLFYRKEEDEGDWKFRRRYGGSGDDRENVTACRQQWWLAQQ